jgi:hypothetical protein
MIEVRGDTADLQCNECEVILKTISAAEAKEVLTKMEAAQPSCVERCTILRTDEHIYGLHRDEGFHLSQLWSRYKRRRTCNPASQGEPRMQQSSAITQRR